MKSFMNENFLLSNQTAELLYHNYAKNMPIIDYHCHLNPREIAKNRRFENITRVWLEGDHYKWRLMRPNGIDEEYITGDAEDREKFLMWAKTLEKCIFHPSAAFLHRALALVATVFGNVPTHCSIIDNGNARVLMGFHVSILCLTSLSGGVY